MPKTCSFDCVYCQLGKTIGRTLERKEYIPIQEIITELKNWLSANKKELDKLNYITLSGSGEPTLNTKIKELILQIKKLTTTPVAVITNASLLADPEIRKQIIEADLIVPSLDAVLEEAFKKVDRPLGNIKLSEIIEGLVALRKEFKGKIWIEVMLVKGLNDSQEHIDKLKQAIDKINPDKIQLNSPVRATAENNIFPVDKDRLEEIKKLFGSKCEII